MFFVSDSILQAVSRWVVLTCNVPCIGCNNDTSTFQMVNLRESRFNPSREKKRERRS